MSVADEEDRQNTSSPRARCIFSGVRSAAPAISSSPVRKPEAGAGGAVGGFRAGFGVGTGFGVGAGGGLGTGVGLGLGAGLGAAAFGAGVGAGLGAAAFGAGLGAGLVSALGADDFTLLEKLLGAFLAPFLSRELTIMSSFSGGVQCACKFSKLQAYS